MLLLRLTTLGEKAYAQALPLAKQLTTIKQLGWPSRRQSWRLRPGRDGLVNKEQEILKSLISVARQQGERTVLLEDKRWEVTAFGDLLATIRRIYPPAAATIIEIGSVLLPAKRVPDVHKEYRDVLDSIDLESMIRTRSEFGCVLGITAYFGANDKYLAILQRAEAQHLSVLNVLEGEA